MTKSTNFVTQLEIDGYLTVVLESGILSGMRLKASCVGGGEASIAALQPCSSQGACHA